MKHETIAHILIVDDDPELRAMLADYLTINDMKVTALADAEHVDQVLSDSVIDLVLLDLRLPGEDGMALARRLRESSAVPIIMLTGQTDRADRIMGLELAADDYLTKPFDNRELLARIRALLRRMSAIRDGAVTSGVRAYRFGGWELNMGTRRLTSHQGMNVPLTNGEFNLLAAFAAAPQRVLTRDQLLERSRMHGAEVYDRSIDVLILRLRRKIEKESSKPDFIKTERRAGYIFDTPVDMVYT